MDITVNGKNLGGSVKAIPSKSQAHRLLICASLAKNTSRINCPEVNADIEATVRCLEVLGADIRREGGEYVVSPIKNTGISAILDCGESGSTLRFLLPVACALGIPALFTGSGRLPQRPLSELCAALRQGGCRVSADHVPLEVSGKLNPGKYRLPGNVSSQYISGMLFALPLMDGGGTIELESPPESEPYIEMTVSALKTFGINIKKLENGYRIPEKQNYVSPEKMSVEGDWSNAAFWLCAGAIGGKAVACTGLNSASAQGDRAVMEILARFGAKIEEKDGTAEVWPSKLRGIEIDAKDIPDLVPVLAVAAASVEGTTKIYNASRLRMKESDRIRSTAELIRSLGGHIEETEDGLVIYGGQLKGGCVDSFGDHRIVMAAAAASAACEENVVILGAQAAKKSYPGFFEDYVSLGGIVR